MPTHSGVLRPHLPFRRPSRSSRSSSRHTAPRAFRPPPVSGSWAVPLTLSFVYCLYAAFVAGDNGWSTGLSWLIALVSAAVLFVLCYAVGRWQHGRQPGAVGAAYAAVLGVSLGYLLSLNSNWSVLTSIVVAVLCAASLGLSVFYVVHVNGRNERMREAERTRLPERTDRRPVR